MLDFGDFDEAMSIDMAEEKDGFDEMLFESVDVESKNPTERIRPLFQCQIV